MMQEYWDDVYYESWLSVHNIFLEQSCEWFWVGRMHLLFGSFGQISGSLFRPHLTPTQPWHTDQGNAILQHFICSNRDLTAFILKATCKGGSLICLVRSHFHCLLLHLMSRNFSSQTPLPPFSPPPTPQKFHSWWYLAFNFGPPPHPLELPSSLVKRRGGGIMYPLLCLCHWVLQSYQRDWNVSSTV